MDIIEEIKSKAFIKLSENDIDKILYYNSLFEEIESGFGIIDTTYAQYPDSFFTNIPFKVLTHPIMWRHFGCKNEREIHKNFVYFLKSQYVWKIVNADKRSREELEEIREIIGKIVANATKEMVMFTPNETYPFIEAIRIFNSAGAYGVYDAFIREVVNSGKGISQSTEFKNILKEKIINGKYDDDLSLDSVLEYCSNNAEYKYLVPSVLFNKSVEKEQKIKLISKFFRQKDLPKFASEILTNLKDLNDLDCFIEATIFENKRIVEKERACQDILKRAFVGIRGESRNVSNYTNEKEFLKKYGSYFNLDELLQILDSVHYYSYNTQADNARKLLGKLREVLPRGEFLGKVSKKTDSSQLSEIFPEYKNFFDEGEEHTEERVNRALDIFFQNKKKFRSDYGYRESTLCLYTFGKENPDQLKMIIDDINLLGYLPRYFFECRAFNFEWADAGTERVKISDFTREFIESLSDTVIENMNFFMPENLSSLYLGFNESFLKSGFLSPPRERYCWGFPIFDLIYANKSGILGDLDKRIFNINFASQIVPKLEDEEFIEYTTKKVSGILNNLGNSSRTLNNTDCCFRVFHDIGRDEYGIRPLFVNGSAKYNNIGDAVTDVADLLLACVDLWDEQDLERKERVKGNINALKSVALLIIGF